MPFDVELFAKAFGTALATTMSPEALGNLMKDQMPGAGRPEDGYLFDAGPFSLIHDDIYSLSIAPSSELTQWIPMEPTIGLHDLVQHLSWSGVPYGFNGSQTYADYLASIVISECGYGPAGTNWDGFSYEVGGGSFSWTTDMMTVWKDSGLRYYEEYPITYNIRGGNGSANGIIRSDKDWALAQLLEKARSHVDYITLYGERMNSDMEWDGLSTIMTNGYIQSHVKKASASASYANPMIVNGATLGLPADPGAVLKLLHIMLTDRFGYAADRNWTIGADDCALVMHPYQLEVLQEALAAGGLLYYTSTYGFTGQMTVGEYEARLERSRANKTLPLGGRDVKVITERNLGWASTIDVDGGGTNLPAHTADIFFLVKRVNGMNVLAQKYIDWNKLDYPFKNSDQFANINGGLARTGFVEEASKCYYYFLEMGGRMVVRMMPLQARLINVTLQKRDAVQGRDQTQFWAPYYAAYQGQQGGAGNQLLFGQRS